MEKRGKTRKLFLRTASLLLITALIMPLTGCEPGTKITKEEFSAVLDKLKEMQDKKDSAVNGSNDSATIDEDPKMAPKIAPSPEHILISITGDDEMTVSWGDKTEYDGIVRYGDNCCEATLTKSADNDSYYRYEARMTGLEEGKTYDYRVGDKDTLSDTRSFKFKTDVDDFSFMYIGDAQYSKSRDNDYKAWEDFVEKTASDYPEISLGIFMGDLINSNHKFDDWNSFLDHASPLFSKMPMMSTVGNHETSEAIPSVWLSTLTMPKSGPVEEEVYSFNYGDCHFVSLNSNLLGSARMAAEGYEETMKKVDSWLEEDLASSDRTWKIVYMHQPMYPIAVNSSMYERMRNEWEDIFVKGGVNLVMCGHQHVYMRTAPQNGNIIYMMSRSGQKPTYYIDDNSVLPDYIDKLYKDSATIVKVDVTSDELTLNAIAQDGSIIDTFTIK